MSLCRACNRLISWAHMPSGRYIPFDPDPVFVIEGDGKDRFVTEDGEVFVGRVARPEEENCDLPVAFVPHWKTCPYAGDFRNKERNKKQ